MAARGQGGRGDAREEAQRRAKLSEELHAREERLVASADEKLRDLSTEIVKAKLAAAARRKKKEEAVAKEVSVRRRWRRGATAAALGRNLVGGGI